MNSYTEERETIADPAAVFQCMRYTRALRAVHAHGGPGLVELAIEKVRAEINAESVAIKEAQRLFAIGGPTARAILETTGWSRATVESACRAVLVPSKGATAINAAEAFCMENGIPLRNGTA